MTLRFLTLAGALSLIASAAFAGASGDFSKVDADKSGVLSLNELTTAMADFSPEDFAAADADRSGGISADEYAAWKSVKTTKDPSQPQ